MKPRLASSRLRTPRGRLHNVAGAIEILEERQMLTAAPVATEMSEPALAIVAEVATPWGAPIAPASTQLAQLSAVDVVFSEAMDTASVETVANWQLWSDGLDASNLIQSVAYADGAARLTFAQPLRAASLELTARESLTDSLGRPLDGNQDGVVGGNFTLEFGIQQGAFAVGPAQTLFEVAQPNWVGYYQLGLSADGGFAIGMVEGREGSLIYEGTPEINDVNYYSPYWEYPRAYSQMYDTAFEELGPLRANYLTELLPIVAVDGDRYQFAGSHSMYQGITEVWERTPGEAYTNLDNSPLVESWLANRVLRVSVYNSGSSNNYTRSLISFQPRDRYYQTLTSITNGDYKDPAFHQSPAGDFVVTWARRTLRYGPYAVVAQRFDVDGNPLTGEIVVDTSATDQAKPSVALASDGTFQVTWTTLDGTTQKGVFLRRFDADGTPLGEVQEIISPTETIGIAPTILAENEGRAVLYWAGDQQLSLLNISAAGTVPFPAQTWSTAPAQKVRRLFSTTNTVGDFLLGWVEEPYVAETAPGKVRVQKFSFGHGAAIDLNGETQGRTFTSETKVDGSPTSIGDSVNIVAQLTDNFTTATLRIIDPLPGDLLAVDTGGTNLTASYASGVLTIVGVDSLANYERVLRTATYASTADRPATSFIDIHFSLNDGYFAGPESVARLQVYIPGSNRVVNRYVSYKGKYDDSYSYPRNENVAVPPEKEAYLPGTGLATFRNITSYDRGINRIVVETYGTAAGIAPQDFTFRMGTSPDPNQWTAAPAPSKLTIGPSTTNPDRTRITIEWPDGAIKNTWLEVTLAANVRTGLAQPDVFYYGNLVGDSGEGNSPALAITSVADALAVRRAKGIYPYNANPYDLNRDRKIDAADEAIVRANFGFLRMLNLPAAAPLANEMAATTHAQPQGESGPSAIASALAMETTDATVDAPLPVLPRLPVRPLAALHPAAVAQLLAEDDDISIQPLAREKPATLRDAGSGEVGLLLGEL